MKFVKLASDMRPAVSQPDRAGRPLTGELVETGVGVDLEHPGKVGQVAPGMLTLAVLAVDISDGRRRRPLPRAIVPGIGPQPPGLGAAAPGIEHRNRRVVGEDLGRGEDRAQ